MSDVIVKKGVYSCPECGSKRITEITQNTLFKATNVNTGKTINPVTKAAHMSNRDKASAYDNASTDDIGCWHYECRACGWKSDLIAQ